MLRSKVVKVTAARQLDPKNLNWMKRSLAEQLAGLRQSRTPRESVFKSTKSAESLKN